MNNEDKIIKMLETIATGQQILTDKVTNIETKLDKIEIRIENEVIDKIRSLYDAREVQNNIDEKLFYSLNRIEAKLDVLQMEAASVRRVK